MREEFVERHSYDLKDAGVEKKREGEATALPFPVVQDEK
jgi:hypothetical protein